MQNRNLVPLFILLSVQCTTYQHWTEYKITSVSGLRYPLSSVRSPTRVWKTSNGRNSATRHPIPFVFGGIVYLGRYNKCSPFLVLLWGFGGRRIERRHFRLDQIQDGGQWPFWKKTSDGHISVTHHPIYFVLVLCWVFLARILALFTLTAHELHDRPTS